MPDKISNEINRYSNESTSVLKGISSSQDLMQVSLSLQAVAARFGFDWPNIEPVFAKLEEEIQELRHEVEQSLLPNADALKSKKRLEDELGDVIFCCMNLARFLKVDPADALQSTNQKFERRFSFIEAYVSEQGKAIQNLSLEELDKAWDLAKEKGL